MKTYLLVGVLLRDANEFRNDVDGRYYDYLLVRGFTDPFAGAGSGPTWHVLARSGGWMLYGK